MLPEELDRKRIRRSGRLSSLPTEDAMSGLSKSRGSSTGGCQFSGATLKEVSIPTHGIQSKGKSNCSIDDFSISDVSVVYDSKSSDQDHSIKDFTPHTSAVPTPTTSVKGKASILSCSAEENSLHKRKRDFDVFIGDPDHVYAGAQTVRSLQAVEQEVPSSRTLNRRSKSCKEGTYVVDSDSDSDSLSAAISVSSAEWGGYQNQFEPLSLPQRRKQGINRNEISPSLKGQNRRGRNVEKPISNDAESDVLNSNDISDNVTDESAFEDLGISDEESPTHATPIQPYPSARRRRDGRNGEDLESWMATKSRNRKARERNKLEKAHPQIKTMWQELESVPIIPRKQVPQPEAISRRLKPFQLEGLNWMIKQEKTHYKGGLLGDEMGMGKTIQAVSLIMSDFPAKSPTLVVVPPVALLQWSKEIEDYTNGKLKVLVFHGQKVKGFAAKDLKKYNVIMISYQSLESLYRKEVKGWSRGYDIIKEDSPIHDLHFHRVILDEAHSIKQRTTGIAKACFALKSTYKWCLSGTPVQNRIGEFFSLMRFLEVRPFADYFCKRCSCSQLHWSLNKDHRCSSCNHSGAEHVSVFNQELLNPIIQTESDALRQDALDKLRLITDRIMLRRMKRDHTSSMELPPKEIVLHNEFFGEVERDFSSSIMTSTTRLFDTYVSRGVMLNNYANIFGLIMQMRQVADHPDLLLRKHAEMGQNVLVCNICDEPAEDAIRSRCKHEFCRSCIKEFIQTCEGSGGTPDCPRCHILLSIDFDQPEIEQDEDYIKKNSIINRIKMENWTSSTKIEMLVYELYSLRNKKRTLKSIVFSQFTSMLQLIEWRLRRAGFNTVMLDGSMTPTQRQRSIDYFMNNPDVEVFLVSLKAGGVALNLTEASRVFIVDPWWNPAAEWQSADRCHRIGQKRPCVITRLCIEDSVESRIVMLQEKKANMINGTINNDKVSMDKLNPEDLQFLFRGN